MLGNRLRNREMLAMRRMAIGALGRVAGYFRTAVVPMGLARALEALGEVLSGEAVVLVPVVVKDSSGFRRDWRNRG